MEQRQPRLYETEQDVRFSDMDPYGHLNAKHFLDLVATSRFSFIASKLNISAEQILEKGIAFYLRKASQQFKSPVIGVQRLYVKSWVAELQDSQITVQFEVRDLTRKVLHATGVLEYVAVDIQTKRPVASPAWLQELFFV